MLCELPKQHYRQHVKYKLEAHLASKRLGHGLPDSSRWPRTTSNARLHLVVVDFPGQILAQLTQYTLERGHGCFETQSYEANDERLTMVKPAWVSR